MEIKRTIYCAIVDTAIFIVLGLMVFIPMMFFMNITSDKISFYSVVISVVICVAVSLFSMNKYLYKFPRRLLVDENRVTIQSLRGTETKNVDELVKISKLGEGTLGNLSGSITYVFHWEDKRLVLNSSRYKNFQDFISLIESKM